MLLKEMATKKSNSRRPESSRSASSKTNTPSISPNRHGEVIRENNQLRKTIESLKAEKEIMRKKLEIVTERLVSNVDNSEYNFDSCVSYSDISTDDIVTMILDITSRKDSDQEEHYLKSRIEEVETRITQISTEFAKLVQLKLRLENGLYDMERCEKLDEMKERAKLMLYDSVSTQIFINPKTQDTKKHKNKNKAHVGVEIMRQTTQEPDIISTASNGLPASIACNLELVDLPKMCGKLPGDTHIKNVIPQLKQVIIQELSLYKGNGSDWRMFAERVGISDQFINQWKVMKLKQPMRNVFNAWSDSPGATVRLLHRHLVSPQLKCIILAKKITVYYIVD